MKRHSKKFSVWQFVVALVLVVAFGFALPEITSSGDAFPGADTTITLWGGCQTNQLAKIFGISPVYGKPAGAGYWSCSCTSWTAPACSGTSYLYHAGTLVSSWFASCDLFGYDQDGNPCLGCCFRTDCTWIVTDSPPTINVTIQCGAAGANGWCVGGAQANVTASDPDGDPITVTCSNPASSGTGLSALPNGTGTKSCTVTANGSSASSSAAWKVDTVAPSASMSVAGTLGANGWYTTAPTVTISGSDATSGVASAVLSGGGSSTTISAEGTATVSGTVTDNAGLTNSTSITVKYDGTPPSISPNITGPVVSGTYPTNVTITVNGADAMSGIVSQQIQIDGGGWVSPGAYSLASGSHTIQFQATDNAGLTASSTQNIIVDAGPPGVTISQNGCGSTITFSGAATDDSGIADVSINLDGVVHPATFGGGTWSYTAGSLQSGNHTAAVTATDIYGKTASASSSVSGDSDNPSITIGGTLNQFTSTALTISDNGSLDKLNVQITVTHDGNTIYNQSFKGNSYPDIIRWGALIPNYQAPYGDKLIVSVRVSDACGNTASASAVMTAIAPTFTPTPTFTPNPTAVPARPTATKQPATPQPPAPTPTPTKEPKISTPTPIDFWDWAWLLFLMIALLFLAINRLADPRPPAWGRLADVEDKKNQTKKNPEDN